MRNPGDEDVDDDLDIEGADEDEFGEAQFDEADIIVPDSCSQTGENDIAMDQTEQGSPTSSLLRDIGISGQPARGRTLRDLVAAGKVSRSGPNGVKNPGTPISIVPLSATSEDLDVAIKVATLSGDKDALIAALRKKLEATVRIDH
jgi:hypothetical protein